MKINLMKFFLKTTVSPNSVNNFRPWLMDNIGDLYDVTITAKARIIETEQGGKLGIDMSQVECEWGSQKTTPLTRKQMNTVKALERFVCIGMNGLEPSPNDMQFIHESFKEACGYRIERSLISDLGSGELRVKSLSDYKSWETSMFIQRIFSFIMEMDMHTEAKRIIGGEIKNLFLHWQEVLGALKHRDHLSLDEYAKEHQFSEVSGVKVPVEKMHMISKGANEQAYQYSWNIIMGTREEHSLQHTMGWERFLLKHKHLKPKYDRARRMVAKLNKG